MTDYTLNNREERNWGGRIRPGLVEVESYQRGRSG